MVFKFSLATVLRIREIAEKREEGMLQQISQEISSTVQAVDRLNESIRDLNDSHKSYISEGLRANVVQASYDDMALLQLNRNNLQTHLSKLNALRESQFSLYLAARRNREMLTEMQTKMKTMHESDAMKREQKVLDDNQAARRSSRRFES